MVKNLSAMQDTQVPLGQKDLLEKGMATYSSILGRRKWQPTPVFFLGKFHEQRSLVVYSLQGCKESDTTK